MTKEDHQALLRLMGLKFYIRMYFIINKRLRSFLKTNEIPIADGVGAFADYEAAIKVKPKRPLVLKMFVVTNLLRSSLLLTILEYD